MAGKAGILIIGSAACLVSGTLEARLTRQEVRGVWRQCIYEGRAKAGSENPRARLGASNRRVARVGRGEPCPHHYPNQRRLRSAPEQPATGNTAADERRPPVQS